MIAAPTLVICGLDALDVALATHDPEVVVSVVGPGEIGSLAAEGRSHIHVACHDVLRTGRRFIAPHFRHVSMILQAADAWTSARPLLIHCHAGLSRSWGAAFIVACHLTAEPKHSIARRVQHRAPWAAPHLGMLDIYDRCFDRRRCDEVSRNALFAPVASHAARRPVVLALRLGSAPMRLG